MSKLLWIDLEMTGLDVIEHKIIEAAVIVTNPELEPLAHFSTAVYQPKEELDKMDAWNIEHHTESGLVSRIPGGISDKTLDEKLAAFIEQHFGRERPILCGNSIHQDRKFIDRYLSLTASKLHYRMLDVSSFKVVFQQFYGVTYKKSEKHQALEDILESIEELKYYMSALDLSKLSQ